MSIKNYEHAKNIFDYYDGSHFQMKRDNKYEEYKKYEVPKELEMSWLQEKKDNAYKKLMDFDDMKEVAIYFGKYCDYTKLRKDKKSIEVIYHYILLHRELLDAYTLYSCLLDYIEVLRFFNKFSPKNKNEIISLLKVALNKQRFISDDYEENGVFPDYLNEHQVRTQIVKTIEYWNGSKNG